MNARDLVTLNLNSTGGSQVVADLNRISAATKELEKQNKELRISKNKTTAEISLARKEVNNYTSQISKQEKAISKASTENENFRKKVQELEAAGKTGSSQWQRYTNRISENTSRMATSRDEITRLTTSQTEARNRLSDLQTQNKAYQTQLDKNNQSIADNKKAYDKAAMTMKTTEMSYNQLSKRQRELRYELNNTSKSLFPDKWNSLNKQLLDVEKQMGKVSAGSQGVSDKFRNMGNTAVKAFGLMVGYAVLQFFVQLSSAVVNFVKEGMQMAAVAEGVRNAFSRLNQPNLLANLKAETKGLINDFLLMQSAVKADKFNIPVDQLGKLLRFAQQRAEETGESVDYLVNSIVNGIGRKSSLILDNLGISATRLQKEVGKAGDFTKGVITIVNEELEKQGELALTSAEKEQQAAVKWQNAQLKVGTSLKWLKDRYNELSGAAADAISSWIDNPLSEQLKKDQNEMSRLVSILNNHNISQTTRDTILKEINSKYPELLKNMSLEVDGLEAIKTKLEQVNKEYDNKIRLSLVDEKQLKPIREERTRLWENEREALDHLNGIADNYGKNYGQGWMSRGKPLSDEFVKSLKDGTIAAKDWSEIESVLGQKRTATKGGDMQYSANIAAIYKHIDALKQIPKQLEANSIKEAEVIETKRNPILKQQEELDKQAIERNKELLKSKEIYIAAEKSRPVVGKEQEEQQKKNIALAESQIKSIKAELNASQGLNDEKKSLIKTQEDLLSQAKELPETTKEELKSKNKQVKAIEDEIKRLKELGIEKEKGTGDKYISKQRKEMNRELLVLENANNERLNKLSENKTNEEQYQQDVIASDKQYYQDRIKYLIDFKEKVKDPKLLEDINKDMISSNAKLIDTNNNLDQARLSSLNKAYDKEYQYAELSKNAQIRILQEKNLSEEEYAAGLEYIDLVYADRRLAIQRQFGEDLADLELSNSELKEKAVIESNEAIVQSEIDAYNRRRDIKLNARDTNVQVRDQYNISTPEERKKREIQALDDLYAAKQISAETHEKALSAIDLKYEQDRLQIRDQYGITSIWERFDAEKDILIQQREQGLLSEEEYQQALSQLKLKYAIETAQNVQAVVGHASNAVNALQQAETDKLDAEYDVRIAAAEGNAAEVERLENEKAQKKLDIEKSYADVQFAVRASEIIGNTAVAIMQGYAQLGPIGGSIAAAFLGITGAAQLASADAERQKVKNMTLKGTTSGSSERFILPGREEGGNIDVTRSQDGKEFSASYQPNKRGYVSKPTVIVGEGAAGQSREWVASNGAVSNPTIRPIIDLIDQEQRRGTVRTVDMNHRIRQRMAGFESGGSIGMPLSQSSGTNTQTVVVDRGVDPLMIQMYQFLQKLQADGIPAIVGLNDIDARQQYANSITQNYIRP